MGLLNTEPRREIIPNQPDILPLSGHTQYRKNIITSPQLIRYFNSGAFQQNMKILREVINARAATSPHDPKFSNNFYPMNIEVPQVFVDMMLELQKTPTVEQEIGLPPERAASYQGTVDQVVTALQTATKPFVTVSTSHETDMAVIDALEKSGIPLGETAIIIFDSHIDLNTPQTPYPKHGVSKADFLDQVIHMGIGSVAVMGPRPWVFRSQVQGLVQRQGAKDITLEDYITQLIRAGVPNTDSELSRVRKFLRVHNAIQATSGKFRAYNIYGNETDIDTAKATKQLDQHFKTLTSKGIKRVIFSFDLDVLEQWKQKITATPYSVFARVVSAGIQDWGVAAHEHGFNNLTEISIAVQALKNAGFLLQDQRAVRKLSPNQKADVLRSFQSIAQIFASFGTALLDEIAVPRALTHRDLGALLNDGGEVLDNGMGGMMIGQATELIQYIKTSARKNGMQFGIPGNLQGTISEAEGVDYQSNTYHAIQEIARAMNA